MITTYNLSNVTHPDVLRKGGAVGTKHHQTDMGLLYVPGGIQLRFHSGGPFITERNGLVIRQFEIQNRSGGVASCGLGFRIANRYWVAGRYDGTTFTDFTASAQSAKGTSTLQVTGADQTGFVIGCQIPFDWVSVNITTAETDAGGVAVPDHAVQYSNAAGTGWTALGSNAALTDDFTLTNTVWNAAVKNFVWAKPTDWGISTGITGLANDYYWIRFTSADREAGDVAAVTTGIEIGVGKFREAIADNGIYASEEEAFFSQYADGLIAYFSTANAGNMVSALVETW